MVTIDTNIAVYALSEDDKRLRAREILALADFASVQVLNEYARTAQRKLKREWHEIGEDLELLRRAVPDIRPIDNFANHEGLRIAVRYKLAFYDALLIAVGLANGANVFYSEDMHHGLVIDGRLTIINPFLVMDEQ